MDLERYLTQEAVEDLYVNGQLSFQVDGPLDKSAADEVKGYVGGMCPDGLGYGPDDVAVEVVGNTVFVYLREGVGDSYAARVGRLVRVQDSGKKR